MLKYWTLSKILTPGGQSPERACKAIQIAQYIFYLVAFVSEIVRFHSAIYSASEYDLLLHLSKNNGLKHGFSYRLTGSFVVLDMTLVTLLLLDAIIRLRGLNLSGKLQTS